MNKGKLWLVCLCGAILKLAVASCLATTPPLVWQKITPPLPAGADLPWLTQGDPITFSWVQPSAEGHQLWYRSYQHDQWQPAVQVAQGQDWFINWADHPSVVQDRTRVAAHFLKKSAAGRYDYDVWLTQAVKTAPEQHPVTFSPPSIAHDDGVAAEHGFVSLVLLPKQQLLAAWLDGRNSKMAATAGATEHAHAAGGMTLRAAIFDQQGNTVQQWQLDDLTCDCCNTAAVLTNAGPVVAYRNRTAHEYRDIYLTRLEDQQWTEPVPVANDGWKVAGCPVNGPALASQGGLLAVAWFTAAADQAQIKLAWSQDSGRSFSAPVVVASSQAKQTVLGRVALAMLADGQVAISWLQSNASQTADLMLALYNRQQQPLLQQTLATLSASRRSGFPALVASGQQLWLSHNDATSQQIQLYQTTVPQR